MEQFVVRLTEQDIDCGSNQNEERDTASRDVGREGEGGAVSRWGEVGQMICNALILRIITQIEIVE